MIVFDLFCAAGHRFEVWFRDGAAFDEQRTASSIHCPTCGDTEVVKAPTPMHVAMSRDRSDSVNDSGSGSGGGGGSSGSGSVTPKPIAAASPVPSEIVDALRKLREHVETSCDYVGERFAAEARSIYYGEKDARDIYGEASADEAKELREEGISVQPLPWLTRRDG